MSARPWALATLPRFALFGALLLSAALSSSAVDLPGLPPAGPPHHATLAPAKEKTLENGLRVIAVLRTGLPVFTADVLIKSGAEADPPKLAGLAHLTADILNQGTATRTAPEIGPPCTALNPIASGVRGKSFMMTSITSSWLANALPG